MRNGSGINHQNDGFSGRRIVRIIYGLSWLFAVLFLLESIYAHNPPYMTYYVMAIPIVMTVPTFYNKFPKRAH